MAEMLEMRRCGFLGSRACCASFLAVAALTGCAAQPAPAGPDTEAFARQVLVDKVDAAVQAQRELAAATSEGRQMLLRKQAALDEDEVDIDYVGRPQPLLESIAMRYGYRYVETGKRQDLKVINVRVQRQPVLEVLKNLGNQIDRSADVVLEKDTKILRLVYKANG